MKWIFFGYYMSKMPAFLYILNYIIYNLYENKKWILFGYYRSKMPAFLNILNYIIYNLYEKKIYVHNLTK